MERRGHGRGCSTSKRFRGDWPLDGAINLAAVSAAITVEHGDALAPRRIRRGVQVD